MACQRGIEAASAAGAAGLPSRGTPAPRAPVLTSLRVRVAMGSETGGCGGAGGGNPLPGKEDGAPTCWSPSIVTPRRDRPDGPFPAGGAMVVVLEHRVDEPPGRGGGEASQRAAP